MFRTIKQLGAVAMVASTLTAIPFVAQAQDGISMDPQAAAMPPRVGELKAKPLVLLEEQSGFGREAWQHFHQLLKTAEIGWTAQRRR